MKQKRLFFLSTLKELIMRKINKEEYLKNYKDTTSAPGREAIDAYLKEFYPAMLFRHYPVQSEEDFYNSNPFDLEGVSIFDVQEPTPHRHLISYGLSELYFNEKAYGQKFSKWGIELTFRISPYKADFDEKHKHFGDPIWATQVMNHLCNFVNETQHWFMPHQFLPLNGPIRLECDTDITGLIFVEDSQLGSIETLHGEVQFLQMVGITSAELDYLLQNPNLRTIQELERKLRENNPLLVTDLNRKSIL